MRGPGRLYIDGAVSAFGVHVTYRESAPTYLRESEIRHPNLLSRGSSSVDFQGETVRAPGCRGWPDNQLPPVPIVAGWRTTDIGMGRRRLAERAANPARRPGGGAFVRQGVKRRAGAERWRVRRMPPSGWRGGCPSKLSAAGCMPPPWDASVGPPPRQRLARRLVGEPPAASSARSRASATQELWTRTRGSCSILRSLLTPLPTWRREPY